jgi:hypothetical protein
VSQIATTRRPSPAPAMHVSESRSTIVPGARPRSPEPTPTLDAEKLTVYQVALDLQLLASGLVPPQHRVLRDQLERASLSAQPRSFGARTRARRPRPDLALTGR